MKYRLTWEEWKDIPLEKKKEFWEANGVDYIKVNTAEDGTMTESANFIPTIIEMIEYLGNDLGLMQQNLDGWYVEFTEHSLGDGLTNLNLVFSLWQACKLKLNK